jgi:D-galactarolactone cycloisomerase
MKIRSIRCAGLRGATPEGGWSNELRPEDCVHTLIAVHTDEGDVGLGSVFTNDALVRASLAVLEPLYRGENALEPERVSEKLHQNMFWLGTRRSHHHTISGIDIALWDLLGKATGQPVGRLLGGRYRERVQPYASLLMDEPEKLARSSESEGAGISCLQDRLGAVWATQQATDEAIVKAAREAVGPDNKLMVDAGGSDAHWTNGYKWALNTPRCSPITTCIGLRKRSRPIRSKTS